jgi:hypothetical protein
VRLLLRGALTCVGEWPVVSCHDDKQEGRFGSVTLHRHCTRLSVIHEASSGGSGQPAGRSYKHYSPVAVAVVMARKSAAMSNACAHQPCSEVAPAERRLALFRVSGNPGYRTCRVVSRWRVIGPLRNSLLQPSPPKPAAPRRRDSARRPAQHHHDGGKLFRRHVSPPLPLGSPAPAPGAGPRAPIWADDA